MPGNRVFVGPLGDQIREEDIKRFFSRVGDVRMVIRKRGFAFVDFASPREAERAIRRSDGRTLFGRRVRVEMAYELEKRENRNGEQRYTSWRVDGSLKNVTSRECVHSMHNLPRKSKFRVNVANLPSNFTWLELKNLFSVVSEVVYADVCHKYGIGFVEFSSFRAMEKAISHLDGYTLKGKSISISPSKTASFKQGFASKREEQLEFHHGTNMVN